MKHSESPLAVTDNPDRIPTSTSLTVSSLSDTTLPPPKRSYGPECSIALPAPTLPNVS